MKKILFIQLISFYMLSTVYSIEPFEVNADAKKMLYSLDIYHEKEITAFFSPQKNLIFAFVTSRAFSEKQNREDSPLIYIFRNSHISCKNMIAEIDFSYAEIRLIIPAEFDSRLENAEKRPSVVHLSTLSDHFSASMHLKNESDKLYGKFTLIRLKNHQWKQSLVKLHDRSASQVISLTAENTPLAVETISPITLPEQISLSNINKELHSLKNIYETKTPFPYKNGYLLKYDNDIAFYVFEDSKHVWVVGLRTNKISMLGQYSANKLITQFDYNDHFLQLSNDIIPFAASAIYSSPKNDKPLKVQLNQYDDEKILSPVFLKKTQK